MRKIIADRKEPAKGAGSSRVTEFVAEVVLESASVQDLVLAPESVSDLGSGSGSGLATDSELGSDSGLGSDSELVSDAELAWASESELVSDAELAWASESAAVANAS